MTSETIIDRIYEAAFVPDAWPTVLALAAKLANSMSGAVFSLTANTPARGRATDSVRSEFDEFIASNLWEVSESIQRTCSLRPASFIQIEDFMTAEMLEKDPVRTRLRASGIGAHACSAFSVPTGEIVAFVFQRWLKDGAHSHDDLATLTTLRPHLARAGLIAARMGLERAQNAVAVMEKLGLPAAVLSARGRVLAANPLLERLPKVFIPRAQGALALPTPQADALLQAALSTLPGNAGAPVRSIPLAASEEQAAMVVHVLPLRRAAHDIFAGGDVLIAAAEVSLNAGGPPVNLMMGLFDLTPAEARLAGGLAAGATLAETAASQGIQVTTARSYLGQILRKTGTHQQSQLVALLKSAQPLPPAGQADARRVH